MRLNTKMATLSLSLLPDIVSEILCRLPVEDLLRFRCVSKPWCSLIDGPNFVKLHLSHSLKTNTNLSVILRNLAPVLTSYLKYGHLHSVNLDSLKTAQKLNHPLDETEKGKGTEILGSCNGLLALSNSYKEIALWNPSTRKSQKLPFTKVEFPPESMGDWQFIVYGFGYDPISDDYKLVRIVQFYVKDDEDSFDTEVKVYSLRTNSWRRIEDFPFYLKYKGGYGILANHALHWVVSRKPESDTKSFVVAFDLRTEEYCVLQLPDSLGKEFRMYLQELGDCLCLIVNYFKVDVIDIWMMKEYGVKESWTKLLSVKKPKVMSAFDSVLPLVYSKSGDKVLLNQNGEKLVWYDLRSKRMENVRIGGAIPKFFEAEMLVGSLVPLNGNGAVINKNKQDDLKKQLKNKKRDGFLSKGFHLVL